METRTYKLDSPEVKAVLSEDEINAFAVWNHLRGKRHNDRDKKAPVAFIAAQKLREARIFEVTSDGKQFAFLR